MRATSPSGLVDARVPALSYSYPSNEDYTHRADRGDPYVQKESGGLCPRFKGQSSCHHRPGDVREGARKDQGKLRVQSGGASHRKAKLLIGENHLRQIRSTLRQGSDQNQQTRRLAGALVLCRTLWMERFS